MRVLYVIDSLQRGGAELSLAALAPGLIAQGVGLEVAHLHDRLGVSGELERAGAAVHSLSGSGGRLGWMRRARDLIGDVRPDLVHTTLFEADQAGRLAARSCGVPVVSSLVGMRFGDEQRSNPGVRVSRMRAAQGVDVLTSRLVRRFHAVSSAIALTMGPRLRIPPDKIDIVPRGRDPDALGVRSQERRAQARARLSVSEHRPVVLAVARHEHVKGLDRLIGSMVALMERLPDVVLLVAGPEGAATPNLEALIESQHLHDQVRLLGSRADVPDLMCAADALVLPSRSEGFPGVLIEAMALETPIVASNLASVREVVGSQADVQLVPGGSQAGLVEALVAVFEHPPDTAHLRERFLERFTVASSARAMVGFYEGALNRVR